MNGASLLPLFLLACASGYAAARPGSEPDALCWRGGMGGIAAIIIVGALIAAAEAGSVTARYLALFAVLVASAATVMILGVIERCWAKNDRALDNERHHEDMG